MNNLRQFLKLLLVEIRADFEPKPIPPSQVDPDLENLDPLLRSTEAIRYSILSLEFWLSPNGQVREWLRRNTLLAVILAIPVLLILPLITLALWQVVSWSIALVAISGRMILLPVLLLVAAISLLIGWAVVKGLFK